MKTRPRISIGIIGQGSFGLFLAEKLREVALVKTYKRGDTEDAFREAASCGYVVLAVPYAAYPHVLSRLRNVMPESSVLVDVCSVKIKPLQLIAKELPGRPVLATHPLFGPQSAAVSLAGQTMILCPDPNAETLYRAAAEFFKGLGLRVVSMSADEHDRLMADLHALTFFVAQGLASYGIDTRDVMTPSYSRLVSLADLERNHSAELFETVQNANPYAKTSRDRFRHMLDVIEVSLSADAEAEAKADKGSLFGVRQSLYKIKEQARKVTGRTNGN